LDQDDAREVEYEERTGGLVGRKRKHVSKDRERLRAELERLMTTFVESVLVAIRDASVVEVAGARAAALARREARPSPAPRANRPVLREGRPPRAGRVKAQPSRATIAEAAPPPDETVISNPEALLAALVDKKRDARTHEMPDILTAVESGRAESAERAPAPRARDHARARVVQAEPPAAADAESAPAPPERPRITERLPQLRADEVVQRTARGAAVIRRRRASPAT
jgi:hypothetical protein